MSQPIKIGDRVALKPHTDAWMRGVRYGTVTDQTERNVWVSAGMGTSVRVSRNGVRLADAPVNDEPWMQDGKCIHPGLFTRDDEQPQGCPACGGLIQNADL